MWRKIRWETWMQSGGWAGMLSHVQVRLLEMWDKTIDGKRTVGQGLTLLHCHIPSRNFKEYRTLN